MSLEIDHVIVCMPDLEDSVPAFETRFGVVSVPGGRHAGHGTVNRLVPLGDTYIELVAVVDDEEAAGSSFGSWVADRASRPGADGVSLRTDDLEAVCERLRLEPLAMSRKSGTGDQLEWRIAGLDRMVADGVPFFIQWDIDRRFHPGRIEVSHPNGDLHLSTVTLAGEPQLLERWAPDVEGLVFEAGEPGVEFTLAPD